MARIQLAYPKIHGSSNAPLAQCIAFEKYDGTNLHWVWHREMGWYAFGMRRHRYDLDEAGICEFHENHRDCGQAVTIFLREFATPLAEIFLRHSRYQHEEISVFTEYFGAHSFAGNHKPDDEMSLVLFDVHNGAGMVPPSQFVEDFGHLTSARVIYQGKLTGKFAQDIRDGKYDVDEGVVCKGGSTPADVWMVKIKTNSYMEKLKSASKTVE